MIREGGMPQDRALLLSKSKITTLLQCPRRLWLEQYHRDLG
jgi:CRISPR/Cas system-associated exonuclease Cas4 (RecB family)